MTEPRPNADLYAAIVWSAVGSLSAGVALPVAAVVLSPDQIARTPTPMGTVFWTIAVGVLLHGVALLPAAVGTAVAARRWPVLQHGARMWMWLAVLGPIALTAWFFGLRNARTDLATVGGAALLVLVVLAVAAGLAVAMKPLDTQAARFWPASFLLVGLAGALAVPRHALPMPEPAGAPAPAAYIAPKLTEANAERPNTVLFLTIDTLRADHLGAWGYNRATSPVLDALAADGLRVHQMTAASSGTGLRRWPSE